MVLIELAPPPTESPGGVALPGDLHLSADIVQEQARNPEKPFKDNIGVVKAIGAWPKTRKGFLRMPEYGVGSKVLFNPWKGMTMVNGTGRLQMLSQDDVLAVLIYK
jgi:co-chaperonin GroES (HSP10)